MQTLKDIAGGLLALIIFVALLALENAVHAQTSSVRIGEGGQVTVQLGPNESWSVQCLNGTLSQPQHNGNTFVLRCQADGPPNPGPGPDPGPEPTPPTTCGDPTIPLYPYDEQKLPPEQVFVNLVSNRVRVYYFNSNDYVGSKGRVSVGPTPRPSGNPSNTNLTVLSECKGDLEVSEKPRSCWAAGYQNNVSWIIGESTPRHCGLKPNTIYRLNIAARDPYSGRDYCKGQCSVVVQSGR